MKFYTAAKKTPNVPIISLLDILAILLIYTVVAFQVKTDEGQGPGGTGVANEKDALKVETPSTDTLVTKTVGEERVQILMASDGQIALQGTVIDKEFLIDFLQVKLEGDPTAKFEVKADNL